MNNTHDKLDKNLFIRFILTETDLIDHLMANLEKKSCSITVFFPKLHWKNAASKVERVIRFQFHKLCK